MPGRVAALRTGSPTGQHLSSFSFLAYSHLPLLRPASQPLIHNAPRSACLPAFSFPCRAEIKEAAREQLAELQGQAAEAADEAKQAAIAAK
jgi:hypothetical protein